MIYLDNAATTFPKPEEVYQTVDFVQRNLAVNIGRGSYHTANEAMHIADETRYLMAKLVGIDNPNKVILTPSATIAANEIIYGLQWDKYKTVYITPFEHNAIARPLNAIHEKYGVEIIQLPFDPVSQKFDVDRAEILFSKRAPDYVFLNQISNVTGAVVPVREISEIAKRYNATVVVDGSQSVGLIDIDLPRDKIDYLIFAGHKNLYASWGIGGFVLGDSCSLSPVLAGGTGSNSLDLSMGNTLPVCFEPASPNIIAIASLNSSLKWLEKTTIEAIDRYKKELTGALIKGLKSRGCRLYLPDPGVEHSSVVSFNIDGYTANELGTVLSQDFDIAVRTGYHCAPYIHDFLGTIDHAGTVRASVGFFNTLADIDSLLSAIDDL